MRGEFFDYDPATGVTEYYEETGDGKFHIHSYQDVAPHMDATQRLRASGGPDAAWRKGGVTMYASLPMIIVHDMLKRGINVFDQNDMPKVISEIETTYKNFKTTDKRHSMRNR